MIKDTINRQPTLKEKKESVKLYNGDKKYKWYADNKEKWHYWSGSGWGDTLWKALINDAQDSRNSIFNQWAENQGEANYNCQELREEYMPKDHYNIYVIIGNKGRKIFFSEQSGGNKTQAINKVRQDIGAEFLGMKYEIIAEHIKPEEHMTDDDFREMCYNRAYEDTNDMENWVEDIDNDDEVANMLGLDYELILFDSMKQEEQSVEDIYAICECGYPLFKEDFDTEGKEYHAECPYCQEDIRTPDEKFLEAI